MTAADRIESTAAALIDAARSAGMMVTGDKRVSEAAAAQSLGYAPGHLRTCEVSEKARSISAALRGAA